MEPILDHAYGVVVVKKTEGEEPLYLLINQREGNYWSFPKGHKEGSETPTEAARRELWEEAGIKGVEFVPNITFTTNYSFEKEGQRFQKTNTYFLALVSEILKTETQENFKREVADFVWVTYGKAKEMLNYKPFISVIDEVHNYLGML